MNYFTETVDATLWGSRAYDDSEYDLDKSAAAKGKLPIVTRVSDIPDPGYLLVIGISPVGHDFVQAFLGRDALGTEYGTITGEEVGEGRVYVLAKGQVVVVLLTGLVKEGRACAWAEEVIAGELGQKCGRIVVLEGRGAWEFGGERDKDEGDDWKLGRVRKD